MTAADEENALYDDLDTSRHALSNSVYQRKYEELLKKHNQLEQECADLQQTNVALGQENGRLEANMTLLYSTAKKELKRKNDEIEKLRNAHRCS